MTEEIIKMAREAGWRVNSEGEILEGDDWHIQTDIVERFFHMAQAAEREQFANHAVEIARRAIEAEREACAKVADAWVNAYEHPSKVIAETIRKRGNP
jgi:hypothetical protein